VTPLETLVLHEEITLEARPGSDELPPYPQMFPWTCTLRNHGRKLVTPFFTAPGLQPFVADILFTLCAEAKLFEETQETFEPWADQLGLHRDSRMAYARWEAVKKMTPKLRTFLDRKYAQFASAVHR
jgi:hypothetical protein